MNKSKIINMARFALNPNNFRVMIVKAYRRVFDSGDGGDAEGNLIWLAENCSDFAVSARELSSELWDESTMFESELKEHAERVLASIDYKLGGGGNYPLIYFITRYVRPITVVETGVAAGFSSAAVLTAMQKNGAGKLFSSDFPYFRLPNPEQYIGIVVSEELKEGWTLMTEGDDRNIPKIVSEVDSIDFMHYDSDKSYAGRRRVIDQISTKLSSNAIIIMDDIQDNSYFRDLVKDFPIEEWAVYEFQGKYVGMLGRLRPNATS